MQKNYNVSFEELNLHRPLLNALADLEYVEPTPIQAEAFSVIMSGRDVIGIAQTGTGKTFAYLLPLLRQMKYSEQRAPRVLILVPTRELVKQLVEDVESLTTYMNVRVLGTYGGTNINTQKEQVYAGTDILVSTPGRLLDLALTKVLRLNKVKKFVVDEFDEMLKLGFRPQLLRVMDLLPERKQSLLFSATFSPEVKDIMDTQFIDPHTIEIAPHGTPLEQIDQSGYHIPNFYTKANLLIRLLEEDKDMSKVLVFVNIKRNADLLQQALEEHFEEGFGVIHSNKSQNYRFRAVENFDQGINRVLIATDILARGLDLQEITHVVNFEMPDKAENYIHRIGRTGRADKKGIAISFITEAEMPWQMRIEAMMKMLIEIKPLPEDLEISQELLESEKPTALGDKDYLPEPTALKESKGAYHERGTKRQKVNLGGPTKRNPKKTKPVNRGALRKKKRKRK